MLWGGRSTLGGRLGVCDLMPRGRTSQQVSRLGAAARSGVTRAPTFYPSVPRIVIFHKTWEKSWRPMSTQLYCTRHFLQVFCLNFHNSCFVIKIARQRRRWGRSCRVCPGRPAQLESLPLPSPPQVEVVASALHHPVPLSTLCPLGCGLLQTGPCLASPAPLHPYVTPLRQPGR